MVVILGGCYFLVKQKNEILIFLILVEYIILTGWLGAHKYTIDSYRLNKKY